MKSVILSIYYNTEASQQLAEIGLNVDTDICTELGELLHEAKEEGLEEITLIEAITDDGNQDYIWCRHYAEVIEKQYCKKSLYYHYSSKSGRGKCLNKGRFYSFGNEVTFNLSEHDQHPPTT